MSVFFSYIILGISLAAPIGPINAAQLDKGIKNGFLHSWVLGIGAMTADIFYMLCVYFWIRKLFGGTYFKDFSLFIWLFCFNLHWYRKYVCCKKPFFY
ncbi:hypothetical protein B4102_2796 [Heyndrickxia sporothermodurans]|uniref:Amino acid transporter n=1 Tax=Heyndrickxia sporothermodurans TaxID=46224 RepID=A0A150L916_9BACI|nr:hypothetical protein B4102_2796 [Heyndrickxia sporothermodurans]